MASSTLISNPETNSDHRRKKKKKIQSHQEHNQQSQPNHAKWKSETQQQIYSSKLLQALSRVSLNNNNSPPESNESHPSSTTTRRPSGARVVREAADRVLAVAARGRTRWSRAILTNRLKLKFRKASKRQRAPLATESSRSKKARVSVLRFKGKNLPAVQRKVRVLGRLVPGCQKQPLPVILEEATDYISALEMQVRAMSALADLLSGSANSPGASSSSAPVN